MIKKISAIIIATLLLSGCSVFGEQEDIRPLDVTVTYWDGTEESKPITHTLICFDNLASGSHPKAVDACVWLMENQDLYLKYDEPEICTEIYGGPEQFAMTGMLAGKEGESLIIERKNGCGIDRWEAWKDLIELSV